MITEINVWVGNKVNEDITSIFGVTCENENGRKITVFRTERQLKDSDGAYQTILYYCVMLI